MKKYLPDIILAFILIIILASFLWQFSVEDIKQFVSANSALSSLFFVFMMIISTVIPPITIFPIIPFAGVVFGPFIMTIYCVIGWVIGSMISFQIARYAGRPFLSRFMSLEKLAHYENKIPKKGEFWVMVFLRMIAPVDVFSYAVGLVSKINFWKFSLASFVGVIPLSFLLAYGYDIFLLEDRLILSVALIMVAIVLAGLFLYKKKLKQ